LYKRLKIGEKVLPEGLRKSCRKVLPGKSFPEVIGKVLPGGHCLGKSFPEVIGKVLPGKSFPEVIVSGASCLESPSRRSLVRRVLPGGHCLGGFLPGESFPEVIGKSFPEVIVWRVLPESPSRRS
jgi:hypothetical protein